MCIHIIGIKFSINLFRIINEKFLWLDKRNAFRMTFDKPFKPGPKGEGWVHIVRILNYRIFLFHYQCCIIYTTDIAMLANDLIICLIRSLPITYG